MKQHSEGICLHYAWFEQRENELIYIGARSNIETHDYAVVFLDVVIKITIKVAFSYGKYDSCQPQP